MHHSIYTRAIIVLAASESPGFHKASDSRAQMIIAQADLF